MNKENIKWTKTYIRFYIPGTEARQDNAFNILSEQGRKVCVATKNLIGISFLRCLYELEKYLRKKYQ